MSILSNNVLISALIAWAIAQALKVPLEYLHTKKVNWALLLSPGGMPSSHSALVSAGAHAIGLVQGFDTPIFALSVILAIIVIYDATGIRRQAGKHAELINAIVLDIASGRAPEQEKQEKLREVLGHTPMEAIVGTILGILTAQIVWLLVSP
ncbi:MAG: divergent PAP2 family protein [Anaerolineales bacterium]|nr:divergent PAP2 family protein [Anaerolineales bacterium]